jgi:tetratricopeptide (TPR) repeat protein
MATVMHRFRAVRRLVAAVALATATWACADREAAEEAYRASVEAMRARDYATAVEQARNAVEADPRLVDGWVQLGVGHSRLEEWDAAIAAYGRALELDPEERRAANNLANVYFRMGRYEQAAEWYARALEIDPDYMLANFHYGWVLRQLNRLDEAERAFAHCARLEPKNERERGTLVDCHYYLGTIHFRRGDYELAARMMEEVLAVRPGQADARHFLGLAYRHLGRMEEAAEQLEIHRRMLQAVRTEPIPEPDE